MKQMYLIGTEVMVNLFSLAGVKGLVVDSESTWKSALEALTINETQVGGLCVTCSLSDYDERAGVKLSRFSFPVLFLPETPDNLEEGNTLASLTEKALGMKLMKGNSHV
jgi:vacuolar-type H+-ATPase subunit F/Vma7